MSLKKVCTAYASYNAWANGELRDFLAQQDEAIFSQELKSSFPTLQKTILHLWDAEVIWLERLRGNSLQEWPGKNFKGSPTEMLNRWQEGSESLKSWCQSSEESDFSKLVQYRNMAGKEFEQEVWQIVMHVCNHGSYHRGQMITMLRSINLSFELPATDLIKYWRN